MTRATRRALPAALVASLLLPVGVSANMTVHGSVAAARPPVPVPEQTAAFRALQIDTIPSHPPGTWVTGARAVAVVGALLTADLAVRRSAEALEGSSADAVAARAKWLGSWRSSAPVYLLGGAALGLVTDGPDGLKKVTAVAAGALAGSTANETVNVMTGRHRPLEERGSLAFRPLRGHTAFPSGHAAYVFAMAAAVDEVTEGPLPALLAYGAATLCGLSRIYHDRHWLSDVVVGAAIGTTVSRQVTRATLRHLEDGGDGEAEGGARAAPLLVAGPGYVGVQLRF